MVSIDGRRISTQPDGARSNVLDGGGLSRIPFSVALAGRVLLIALRQIRVSADSGDSASLRSMQARDFDNRRYNFPGYPHAPHNLVASNMVGYDLEEWR
jgi:hypothetical protein